ncbi:hypothetical protein PF008_g10621 [Phytophthora fragariae]|uniref:Uncharacterized protein n=1 Tax=Phytophthora fragariae TaxID=53985 RepID=A0A6G0RTR7_9STRA|nr:hypothetical protein PF008_g10621 [Phytophthora fragariae]
MEGPLPILGLSSALPMRRMPMRRMGKAEDKRTVPASNQHERS